MQKGRKYTARVSVGDYVMHLALLLSGIQYGCQSFPEVLKIKPKLSFKVQV